MTTETGGMPPATAEAVRFVAGRGRFSDDLRVGGAAFGAFVRSPHPHAAIRGIATGAAAALTGVVRILTAADMEAAGVGSLSRPVPQQGRHGRPLVAPHRPALAGSRVVHVGEPVALVVAETAAMAADAAEAVEVDYEPLPSVSDATEALGPDAPLVWPEAPGNLALDWPGPPGLSAGSAEAARNAIVRAPHVVRIRVANQRLAGAPMETRGATAIHDAATGRYTLHAPSQGAAPLRNNVAAILGIEPAHLRVLSGDVGGAFGLKTPPYPEYLALLVAAKLTGRPVTWMASRSEAFLSDHQCRDNLTEAVLALDVDGRFLALSAAAVVNLGAYLTQAGAIIATNSFANCFPTVYDIPHLSISVRLAFTNTVPTGPYRGAGRPEANYVMECLVEAAARQTGIDPAEIRRRNFVRPSAMPWRSPVGNLYDSGDFAAAFDAAMRLADRDGFGGRRREAAARGRLRGFGISCFLEHAGGAADEGATLAVEDGTVVVGLGIHGSGQGHAAIYARLAAERLGISADRVVVRQGDSDIPVRGGPAVGSRSTALAGAAVVKGVAEMIEAARHRAADRLEASVADIEYERGVLRVAGTDREVALFDLADAPEAGGLLTVAHANVVHTFPNGCHVAEVEVDPETGRVDVVAYAAVDDCGVVLDHTLAEAQVVGGIVQGLGQALTEAMVNDASGQPLTGSFLDYAMPRADNVPPIVAAFSPTRCTTNPLGVKGIGEAGSTAAIAAIMNAIADAVPAAAGMDMPATAEKVWRACMGGSPT